MENALRVFRLPRHVDHSTRTKHEHDGGASMKAHVTESVIALRVTS